MRSGLCALLVVLLGVADAARAERLPVRAYGLADGLPSTFVDHIVSDSRGLLWFSTRDGLARFDGSRFVTYGIDDGLPVPTVNFLLETRDNTYWVATNGGGVCRMDTAALIAPAAHAATMPSKTRTLFQCVSMGGGAADLVNVLAEDSRGRIWVGTDDGLYRFDVRAGRDVEPERLDIQNTWGDRRPVLVGELLADVDGEMWVGTNNGLLRVAADDRPWSYPAAPAAAPPPVRGIARAGDGHVWVAYDSGLLRICTTASSGTRARHSVSSAPAAGCAKPEWVPLEGRETSVSALVVSADGHVWIGTARGLLEFDGRRFRRYESTHGLPERLVSALGEDRDGNLWLASLSGISKLSQSGFLTYDEHDGLTADRIRALYEDANGQVFAVGDPWVVSRFDGARFVSARPRVPPDPPAWGAQLAFLDRRDAWWIIGVTSLGRYPAAHSIEEIDGRPARLVYERPLAASAQRFMRLFEDVRGDIWWSASGGATGELGRWDRRTQTFMTYPDVHGRMREDWPSAFGEDASGNLWVGFSLGGLVRYDGSRFERLTGDGVPKGAITSIHRDRFGRLWIGSSSDGVTRVDDPDASGPRFVRYTTREGLSTGNVRCITSDALGRIYVGTARGVDRIDPRSGIVRRYTTDDGLANGFVTAALHDSRGRLWFGTMDGLSRLVTADERPAAPPTTWIDGWRVNGVAQPVSHLGQTSVPGIVLEPNQNHVEIDFYAVSFRETGALRYEYRLDGADRGWSRPGEERVVHYSRLSPGRYQFQVRAVTGEGLGGTVPASMEFVVLPPVSQRLWFRSSSLAVVLLIVLAAHRYRVTRLLALGRVRMRIADDLHDDIGGSLSRISIQSEVACRETLGLGEQPRRRFMEIADSARGLVDALGDVVWSVDPRQDDLASVCRRLREYADDLFPESGVRWRFAASGNLEFVKLDPETRRNLFLLLKEAVTNVAQHAKARSVSLSIELTSRELRAELKDDGCGFDQRAPEHGDQSDCHGLSSMRARADRLGARLTVESSPGIGTTVCVNLPIARPWGRMNCSCRDG